jgi:hypothetical protein
VTLVPDSSSDGDAPRPQRPRRRRKDPLGPDGEIGSRLRALYSEVEQEPIPSELVELLEKLSEAERRSRS